MSPTTVRFPEAVAFPVTPRVPAAVTFPVSVDVPATDNVPEPVVAILPDVLIVTSFANSAVPIASSAISPASNVSALTPAPVSYTHLTLPTKA